MQTSDYELLVYRTSSK